MPLVSSLGSKAVIWFITQYDVRTTRFAESSADTLYGPDAYHVQAEGSPATPQNVESQFSWRKPESHSRLVALVVHTRKNLPHDSPKCAEDLLRIPHMFLVSA